MVPLKKPVRLKGPVRDTQLLGRSDWGPLGDLPLPRKKLELPDRTPLLLSPEGYRSNTSYNRRSPVKFIPKESESISSLLGLLGEGRHGDPFLKVVSVWKSGAVTVDTRTRPPTKIIPILGLETSSPWGKNWPVGILIGLLGGLGGSVPLPWLRVTDHRPAEKTLKSGIDSCWP